MLSNYIGLFGDFARSKYDAKSAYGNFKLMRQVTAGVERDGLKATRSYNAAEPYTALGDIKVAMGDILSDPRGLNVDAVNAQGELDVDMINAMVRKYGGGNHQSRTNIEVCTVDYLRADSQVSLLVGLLSTGYVQYAHENKIVPVLEKYDDGHLAYDRAGEMYYEERSSTWQPDDYPEMDERDLEQQAITPERDTIVLQGLSASEGDVILAHLSGRKKTTKFAFDLEVPVLTKEVHVVGRNSRPTSMVPRDVKSQKVFAALNKYVEKNRLHAQFEIALAIYCQCALQAVPDSAEGMCWMMRTRSVILPRFASMRGDIPAYLRGQSYGIDASATESWRWWKETGLAVAVTAAPLNVLSLWGRYLCETDFLTDEAKVKFTGVNALDQSPAAAYYSYASLFAGSGLYCPIPLDCGLQYEEWDTENDFKVRLGGVVGDTDGYHVDRVGEDLFMIVDRVPPPASPLNVLGRMPENSDFSALAPQSIVNFTQDEDSWLVDNVDQAWSLGMALRWMGFDMEASYKRQAPVRANWASNESQIAQRPYNPGQADVTPVRIHSIEARGRKFQSLPSLVGRKFSWNVNIAVSPVTHIVGSGPGIKFRPRGLYMRSVDAGRHVSIPQEQSIAWKPVIITAFDRGSRDRVGFQLAEASTGPFPSAALKQRPVLDLLDEPPTAPPPSGEQ